MMRNVKTFRPEALIGLQEFRSFVESFESELLRGISTLSVLSVIQKHSHEGIYGYQLLKDLETETKSTLVIEEGTLYPILRKLEKEGILFSEKRDTKGRQRKYYLLTERGEKLLDHMKGFFSKLTESIAPLMGFEIELPKDIFYCPNCANKINAKEYEDGEIKFCNICGLYIEELFK